MSAVKQLKVTDATKQFRKTQPFELKALLEPVVSAAFMSHANAVVIGEPGYGKTEILMAMMNQAFGEEHTLLFPCVPSTLPPDIIGYANPVYALDPEAEAKGMPFWITRGTPVDESIRACLLDEISRFGDLGADTAVHAMHNISKFHRPVYFGTANWLTPSPRNEAMRDRFSFTVWYQPSVVDVGSLVNTPAIQTWSFDIPDYETICFVNENLGKFIGNPGKFKAAKQIVDLLHNIVRVCEGTKFRMNNRRVFQMRSVLYTMGSYYANAVDFTTLPREAFKALEYAYPTTSFSESLEWRKIINSLVDVNATKIAEFKSGAYGAWKNIYSKYVDRAGNFRTDARDAMSREIGNSWASQEKILMTEFADESPQVIEEVRAEMYSIYRQLMSGKNPLG